MPDDSAISREVSQQKVFIERPWIPIEAPFRSEKGARSAATYEAVINQFDVETNPRYRPRDGKTYCNIFVWDVTSAMNAEIPHWTTDDGKAALETTPGAKRRNVNAIYEWLHKRGPANGWRTVEAEEAQAAANRGEPTVAIWPHPSGSNGHVAMIRPGVMTEEGPATAQAGLVLFANGRLSDSFPSDHVAQYWTHE